MIHPSEFGLANRIAVSSPGVCVQFDDAGNATCNLDEELVAANSECSSCENDTDTSTGTCGRDY